LDYIYVLKGSGTFEFYRYKVSNDSWETMTVAPNGLSSKPFKYGSSISYDGGDTIWCMKGTYNELSAYSISGNNWVDKDTLPKVSPPGSKKTKVKDGSQIACDRRAVYALKGDNTDEFWMYKCDDRAWYTETQIPAGSKAVKGGGALVCGKAPMALYALRGNNTLEFWEYGPVVTDLFALSARHEIKDVQDQSAVHTSQFALSITPDPTSQFALRSPQSAISYSLPKAGSINLALYDVSGRLVGTIASGYHPAGTYSHSLLATHYSLVSGVYVLRLSSDAEGSSLCRKLVIE
jgi:hypothetical protein